MSDAAEKRSAYAQQLMKDDLFQEIMQTIEDGFILHWRHATVPDVRENAWHGLKGLELFKMQLQSVADDKAVTAFNRRRTSQ
jgi:hypothetical protein